ncbi:hypothetical protein ABW20_dc0110656 [Dactylellina cionopaga]|nr:hypothetical protein ABW20_dc0110656 [Dactylellina cionopaga]
MPLNITALPPEILLNIAGFLSNNDVAALTKVFPYMGKLTTEKSFHRWQRLVEEFRLASASAFDAIERSRRETANLTDPVAASSLTRHIPEAETLENIFFPRILNEMQISISAETQIQLDDIFLSLERLGNSAGLPLAPLVDLTDPLEGSKRLRSALDSYVSITSIMSLLPASISQRISSIQPSIIDRLILTAYLLFTKLQPNDILGLLPKHSKYGYVNEQVLAEHLSYMLLFLKVYRFDNSLWIDTLRSTKNQVTDRVRWMYANGSPLSAQSLQILRKRIEEWFIGYHEAPTPFSLDSKAVTLTNEQKVFVETDIAKGEIFKVRAYAGTGKTKCLVDYASRRPRKRLFVAFNALYIVNPAVSLQVRGKSSDSASRRGKLSRIQSAPTDNNFLRNWETDTIVQALDMTLEAVARVFTTPCQWRDEFPSSSNKSGPSVGTATNPKNPENLARVITTGIDRFCQSNDPEPEITHLSMWQCRTKLCNPNIALEWLKRFWKKIMAGESPMMTHDCYLKMFSLTENLEADKATFGKYDIVLFDEAQDANPCMADIIIRQREAAGIVIIGDPYQMIYGFKGAKNECFDDERLPPTQTFHLTKSFRFGQEIADVANLILQAIGEKKPVRGVNTNVPSPAVFLPSVEKPSPPPPGRHTVIFRKNTELVKYFFSSFAENPALKMYLKTTAANASTAIISLLKAGYYLYQGKPPRHPRLRGIRTFEEAKSYLQREDEVDTDEVDIQAIGLVVGMEIYYKESHTSGGDFLKMLDSSAESMVDYEEDADVVLTTAHQAKGLEWDDVIVADDFMTQGIFGANSTDDSKSKEAANLLYVACTRARNRLQLSQGVGMARESEVAWSDAVFKKGNDAGIEYDDDDLDDFIMGFEGEDEGV